MTDLRSQTPITEVSVTVKGVRGQVPEKEYSSLPKEVMALSAYYGSSHKIARIAEAGNNKNIALYGIDNDMSQGVLLQWENTLQWFDWIYSTPRTISPQLYFSDFDGDGELEIAAILYVGSGTGVSVEELHIIEYEEGNLIDYCLPHSLYRQDLTNALQFSKGQDFYTVSVGNLSLIVPADQETLDNCVGEIYVQDLVDFSYFEDYFIMRGIFGIMVSVKNPGIPYYPGTLFTDISYKDGAFKLYNFALQGQI